MTAHDLAVYMMMHMNYGEYNGVRIISEESSKLMQTPAWKGRIRYGLCLTKYKNYVDDDKYTDEEMALVGHSGSAYGLRSVMIWSPTDGWGIIVMTNGYAANRDRSIMKSFVNAIYNACIK